MGAEAIQEIEKTFASDDARVAEVQPEVPAGEEEAAASVDDAGTEVESVQGAGAEHDEGGEPESGDKPRLRKKPGVHNRIGELTREKYEARREAEQERREKLAIQAKLDALQSGRTAPDATPTGADTPLTLEAFDFDQDKYLAALAERKARDMLKQAEDERARAEAQRKQQEADAAFKKKADAFANDHDDFYDVVFGNQALPISDVMAGFIRESEHGPALAYHLGTHIDEATAISNMPAYAAGAALARLEDRLVAPPQTPSQPAQITRAPPVANRVAAAAPGVKSMESMADHIAAVREKARR
jgi:hypothetical protein